jgi:Pyridoxamine 5'-phosphate oxidase
MEDRVRAVEAYMKALRTGEASATVTASRYLAPDVVLDTVGAHMWGNGHEEFIGYDETVKMITGIGVMTGVYRTAPWSNPAPDGDGRVTVSAEIGGLLASSTLTFSFNHHDQIIRIEQVNAGGGPPAPPSERIPPQAKALINSALANNTPMIVAYTDENGAPNLSLRGSTQVYSDTQLSIWLRHATGGMAKALQENPSITLMYRDPPARATLTIEGRAHIDVDPEVRDRVFELAPEVEQKHDPRRIGASLIIDVMRMTGNTPRGAVRMQAAPAATKRLRRCAPS